MLARMPLKDVLVYSGCINKNITNWLAKKQQTFISHSDGARVKARAPLPLPFQLTTTKDKEGKRSRVGQKNFQPQD